MKALFVAVLAAGLVGCASHPETAASRKSTGSKVSAKTGKSIAHTKTKAAAGTKYTGTISPSAASPKSADAVTEKAKAAIAAMLDDPASAEFYQLQRAQR